MSTNYLYDVTADTANGRVNIETLIRAVMNANLASGGNLEGGEIEGGALDDTRHGVVIGGTLKISWENTLSGSDETDQDGIVAAHLGDSFAVITPISAESLGTENTASNMTKLTLTPSGPLAEGEYKLSASAEIRVQSVVAGSHAQGVVNQDATELIQHNNDEDMFEAFGITTIVQLEAGSMPTFEIALEVVGNPNVAEIRQARISLQRA